MKNTKITPETLASMKAAEFAKELADSSASLNAMRSGSSSNLPVDISLEEFSQERYGLSRDAYMEKLGISTKTSTMQNIFSMPNKDFRWLVPEIIREAIMLGINQAPFFPNIITADQPVSGLNIVMPYVNQAEAAPERVGQGETIPLGAITFGQKNVNLFKIGKGMKLTDEVKNYVSLDVLSIFVRDFGIQLGYALDNLAMDVLINGNKPDGSESVPVVGVYTKYSLAYKDLLRLWVRASRMGRNFQTIIGGEDKSIELLNLPEFKDRHSGTTNSQLVMKSPVPSQASFYIHSGTSASQVLLVDPRAALMKLTAQNLLLESERIVSNQSSSIYASLTTGFSKMYQDASVIIDTDVDFTQFPPAFDVDPFLNINL